MGKVGTLYSPIMSETFQQFEYAVAQTENTIETKLWFRVDVSNLQVFEMFNPTIDFGSLSLRT